MKHSHVIHATRDRAEKETRVLISRITRYIIENRKELIKVKDRHVNEFPYGPLTCSQVDKVTDATELLETVICKLEQLLTHLPNEL